jgi:hypothetical protein
VVRAASPQEVGQDHERRTRGGEGAEVSRPPLKGARIASKPFQIVFNGEKGT